MAGEKAVPQNGSKVSTTQFYTALLGMKDEMGAMERRIMEKLDGFPSAKEINDMQKDHDDLAEKFEKHREKDKVVEILTGIGTIASAVIGAIFGQTKI